MNQWVIQHQIGIRMTEQEEADFDEMQNEMMFLDNIKTDTQKDELVAMYYTALQVIGDNTDMNIVEVHNEVIMSAFDELRDESTLMLKDTPRTH